MDIFARVSMLSLVALLLSSASSSRVMARWPSSWWSLRCISSLASSPRLAAVLQRRIRPPRAHVRWTIRKPTVAAELGSTYVGIAAAGALVVAMAPLQRALAERAVPMAERAEARGPGVGALHEEAYRDAVRLALRGGITPVEEERLARIVEAHGLGPVRALALHREAEPERVRAGTPKAKESA